MTQEQALQILVQAVQIGQAKGAYTLEEAGILAQAVSVFVTKSEKEALNEAENVVKTEKVKKD